LVVLSLIPIGGIFEVVLKTSEAIWVWFSLFLTSIIDERGGGSISPFDVRARLREFEIYSGDGHFRNFSNGGHNSRSHNRLRTLDFFNNNLFSSAASRREAALCTHATN
jgi:hypothetical protein